MNPFTHFLSALCLTGGALFAAEEFFPVKITVDAARPIGPLKPIWRFFGADEPNYAYMKDGKKLLGELGELKPREMFFRTHSLLVTGEGTHASCGTPAHPQHGRPHCRRCGQRRGNPSFP